MLIISVLKINFVGVNLGFKVVSSLVLVFRCLDNSLPFNYLGLSLVDKSTQLLFGNLFQTNFTPASFHKRSSLLSFRGRLVLIKCMLSTIPIYPMSVHFPPLSTHFSLLSMMSHFVLGFQFIKKDPNCLFGPWFCSSPLRELEIINLHIFKNCLLLLNEFIHLPMEWYPLVCCHQSHHLFSALLQVLNFINWSFFSPFWKMIAKALTFT